MEGLLMNNRVVQATFDDENSETRSKWAYPDTRAWDAERNLSEFLDSLPLYRDAGLLAVTVNFQGGNPQGYNRGQPWENNAFTPEGEIRPAYMSRMERVLDRANELGMVVILGVFYFGQDQRLKNEAAVIRALDEVVSWLLVKDYHNVLLEVNNECNVKKYVHEILMPDRVSELIERVRETTHDGADCKSGRVTAVGLSRLRMLQGYPISC